MVPRVITVVHRSSPLDGEVRIEGDSYRHLCRARRVAVGDRIRLTDGRGAAVFARIAEIGRRQARLRVDGEAPTHEPAHLVELWVGTLRAPRASWLVEKATELGVGSVRFFRSERTVRDYGAVAIERLQRVAAAAVEQSHRAWIPPISGVHDWSEVTALAAGVFLQPGAPVTCFTARGLSAVVLVGPEGGWSPEERRQLVAAGHVAVGLGERTLRVETAALAALAVVQQEGATGAGSDPSDRRTDDLDEC